jgi:polar amino acid transport system substrate-binding protein
MQRRPRLLAALATLLAVGALSAQADQLGEIRQKGTLVVGVLGTDQPNSFIDPATRELVGYDVDIGAAIARKIGVKPVFKQLAVAARIPELQQGRVDVLAASLTHTREREPLIDFSLTTLVTGQKVIVRKSSGITQLAQLAGRKVVTVKGGTQEINIRRAVPTVEVVVFETAQQAYLAFQQGKGVGYVNDEVSALNDFAKLGPARQNYLLLPQSISVEPIAIGIRKGERATKAAVDGALRELESSGEAEKLFLKWFGPSTPLAIPKREFTISSDQIGG